MNLLPHSVVITAALSALTAGAAFAAPQGGTSAPSPKAGAATSPMTSSGAMRTTPTSPTSPTVRGPIQTGQPNQTCGSATAPNTPGASASAPGSAFNPNGKAGSVYAGQQPQNSRNTASVAQYDAACAHAK